MKKLGIGLGILIGILIGSILIVPSFLNWNEYKDQIEKTASDYTGRDVKIMGDISLSLLPTSALSVKDVSVTNLAGGRAEYMLSLKSLDIKVSFPSVIASLFGGKVKVEKFILVDPVVALEVLKDGRVNWEFGGTGEAGPEEQAFSADISLDKFQIVNGQISFEDMASRQMELLRKINVNVKVKSINGPLEVAGSAKYKGLDTKLDLSLGKNRPGKKVPVTLAMDLLDSRVKANVIGGVILSGKDSFFAGKLDVKASDAGDLFSIIDRFKGLKIPSTIKVGQDFALDTEVEATSDKVVVEDLNIRMGQSRGQGNAEISVGEKIKFLAALSVNKLDIDPLLAAFAAEQKNAHKKAANEGEQDKAGTELLNRLSGKLDLKLGALKYNEKIASQISVKLQAKDSVVDISTIQARMPGGSALVFKGQLTPPDGQKEGGPTLSGDVSLNASNLRGLLSWLKMEVKDIPSGQLAQFSYKSGVKVTPDLLQLYAIDGKLDTMSFKGGVSYALAGRPSYGIGLDIRNLNLDSYMTKGGPKSDQKNDLKKALAVLDEFDVNYKIALSNLSLNGIKVRSGKLDGLLLGGNLDAKTIKLNDVAGIKLTASGRGKNFSSKPEFTVNLSASAKSLSMLQRALKLNGPLDLRKLGQVKLDGSISSTLEKMDVDLKSTVGVNKLDVKGTIRSATLKQFPEIGSADLEIDGRSASLAALIDQLDLPMTKPHAQDDRFVRLKGRFKTSSDLVDLDGMINIAGGEIMVKGRSKGKGTAASLDMSLDMKGPETREFIRGLGIDFQPAAEKLGPIALRLKVAGTADQFAVSNIVGDVGPVKLSGSGKLNLATEKPSFDFNLKAGKIPLHDFLKKSTEKKIPHSQKTKSKSTENKFGAWSREPMELATLSAVDGRMRISAASLRYNGYVFENPTFETVLKDGLVSVNNFTGRLFGGDVVLSGVFGGAVRPKLEMNMTLKKASLSQATKSLAGVAPVSGFFDLSGKFSGEGSSQYDLISSLSGDGKIVATPGLISGIDIPALSSKLSEMNSNNAFLDLLGTALSGGETPYKGGASNIVIKNGVIQFSPFDVELDGAQSNMKMTIDLVNWKIRSNGSLSLVEHPHAPPIEVNITGDVSNPDINYKTDRLKKYVGAKIASNMLQKIIGGEGGLEGIFGDKPKRKEEAVPPPKSGVNEPAAEAPAADVTDAAQKASPAGQKPESQPQPVEEFGKRLLEKLFNKEKKDAEKKDGPEPDEPNP